MLKDRRQKRSKVGEAIWATGWGLLYVVAIIVFVLASCFPAHGQDIHVNCANINPCTLTPAGGLPWSNANQTWIFTPQYPNTNVYIHIHNQNTTTAHTQTVTMFQTPFGRPTAPTRSNNSDFWVQDSLIQNDVATASCNNVAAPAMGTCYAVGMQAAQIAIRITGASTQAGSPDNVDISITQSQATYPGGPQPGAGNSTGDAYNDPCANLVNRQSVVIASAGALTQFIPAVANQKIYICGIFGSFTTGTAGSSFWFLGAGTGVNCATNTVTILAGIPAVTTTAATIIPITFGGGTQTLLLPIPLGDALCSNTGGTGSVLSATMTFVQQ